MADVVDSVERRAENVFRLLGLDRIAARRGRSALSSSASSAPLAPS